MIQRLIAAGGKLFTATALAAFSWAAAGALAGAAQPATAPAAVPPVTAPPIAASPVAAPPITAPPVAAIRPFEVRSPNGARVDEYYWLRDDRRSNPQVLAHLAAENAWTEAVMAHTAPAQEILYRELVGRVQQDDSTVPVRKNGWWYYRRFVEGKEYPIHARRQGSLAAPEQVMLDGNALAAGAGHGFFQIS